MASELESISVSMSKLSFKAEKLLRLLYKRYLDMRSDGVTKSEAFAVGDVDYICNNICPFYNVVMSNSDIDSASDELYKYDLIFKNHFDYVALKNDFVDFCVNSGIRV